MARSRPEDIEYINRLKFGSQFNYMPKHHGGKVSKAITTSTISRPGISLPAMKSVLTSRMTRVHGQSAGTIFSNRVIHVRRLS